MLWNSQLEQSQLLLEIIAKISGNSILEGVETTILSLGSKLHSIESNIEKLSDSTVLIGIKCAEMELKVAELLVTINGENIPVDLIA